MTVWRCSVLSLAVTLLTACVAAPEPRMATSAPESEDGGCASYAKAWVDHFRAHVAGADTAAADRRLLEVRAQLVADGVAVAGCELPYCMIQPLAGGRLDSYCGYRRPDPSGRELNVWIPFG